MRNAYSILVGKLEGKRKRPIGRPRHGWEINILMDFIENVCEV
jgi:hypothetical protein